MKIAIEHILPDPDLLDKERRSGKLSEARDGSRAVRTKRAPVVLRDGPQKFVLFAGVRQLRAARDAGESELDCTVKDELTPQEREELRLAEMYNSGFVPPMELGKAFMKYRDAHAVTQQELARRTGITPGTIHHYESLIRTLDPELGRKVDNGELTFKEARSIADILDHRRQREIAAPFLDGRLSSVHVERVVGRAKSAPELAIARLIDEVLNGTRTPEPERAVEVAPAPVPPPSSRTDTDALENNVLKIAGELDALRLQTIPEYRRLKMISSLRILDSRLRTAMAHLNTGVVRESDRLRSLSRF